MSELDPNETLREFHEYFARSYEARGKLADRIGIHHVTLARVFAGSPTPTIKMIDKLRMFVDAESKRLPHGNGVRPIERVPMENRDTTVSN